MTFKMKTIKCVLFWSLTFLAIGLFTGHYITKKRLANAEYQVVIKNQAEAILVINHKKLSDDTVYFTEEKKIGVSWRMDNRGKRNVYGSSCDHQHFEEMFEDGVNF